MTEAVEMWAVKTPRGWFRGGSMGSDPDRAWDHFLKAHGQGWRSAADRAELIKGWEDVGYTNVPVTVTELKEKT